MPTFIFYLAVFLEALGIVCFLTLNTQFFLGCGAAVLAFIFDCQKTDMPAAKRKNELYVMTLCLLYSLNIVAMSYITYVSQYKQWISGVNIQPLYERPFDYPVGARLTVQLAEPLTPFYYTLAPTISRLTDRKVIQVLFGYNYIPGYEKKLLTGKEVSLDLYFSPYKRLYAGDICMRTDLLREDAPSFAETERLSMRWNVHSTMMSGERQFDRELRLSDNALKMMRELPESFSQFFPENLDKKGFKVKENKKHIPCYVYPMTEKKNEAQ